MEFANARYHNHEQLKVALERFETEMNKKCSSYMEASMLKNEFEEQKRQTLEFFRMNGKQIGQSYLDYIKQLEEDITKKYSVYNAIMEHFKVRDEIVRDKNVDPCSRK